MYTDIKEQFKSVIRYSQGIEDPKVDKLFEVWEQAKQKFIKRFGGLIYEWPVSIEFALDAKDRRSKAKEFVDYARRTFHNDQFTEFLDANIDTFFENQVFTNPTDIDIPKGMKLIKAFKFFEKDKEVLTRMQDLASQYIQENKIRGTLCFSVHPLDFLSSSENTYRWRSCHSLDGEFRAGNLSYMTDDTTFMVYLKGADNAMLPNFPESVPWNSKRWRMLLHEHPESAMIFAGRQYPFASDKGLETVLNVYNHILMETTEITSMWRDNPKFLPWSNEYITHTEKVYFATKYLIYNEHLLDLEDVVHEGPSSLNYNDILFSSCYTKPYYAVMNSCSPFQRSKNHILRTPINLGGPVICLHCGIDLIEDSGYMRCNDCEYRYGDGDDDNYTYCSCCDSRIYLSDCYYVNDEPVCDYCVDTECFSCDHCGEYEFNDNANVVKIGEGDNVETKVFCDYCFEEYENEKEGKE